MLKLLGFYINYDEDCNGMENRFSDVFLVFCSTSESKVKFLYYVSYHKI